MTRSGTRVKICGIRRPGDALLAAEVGADAVGVLVGQEHPSDDFVAPEQAAAIFSALPPFVTGVLVSHRVDPAALLALLDQTGAQAVQVHGAMPPDGLLQLRRRRPRSPGGWTGGRQRQPPYRPGGRYGVGA